MTVSAAMVAGTGPSWEITGRLLWLNGRAPGSHNSNINSHSLNNVGAADMAQHLRIPAVLPED